MRNAKFLILGLFFIILQTTIIGKYLDFLCIHWDIISIFIILLSLYKVDKDNYKIVIPISLIQDIITQSYFIHFLSKTLITFIAQKLHNKFFLSSFWIKSLIVLILSAIDILFKIIYTFLISTNLNICFGYIIYLILNFIIFYFVYLAYEDKNTKI
ncbi:hypothetical protein CLV39_0723 [Hydrogenothermus marinus]|uniref:Rod shape-determining protein MreD n=1 Tax=Hydrogenothermus marinus TaxID=133270 RepID=A0A3M0BI71_9AQUI|nr:hypothetical protein CLV39_0723 [Hydrogenothermus marinus]